MAQEKFEERLGEVADVLEDILDDCNTELTGKGAEEASNLNAVPSKIRSIPQGGGGGDVQTDWNQQDSSADDFIKNKPFDVETTFSILSEGTTLYYNPYYSEDFGITTYSPQAEFITFTQTIEEGNTVTVSYGNSEVNFTVINNEGYLVSDTYAEFLEGTLEPPAFLWMNYGAGIDFVLLFDDNLPAEDGSSITISATCSGLSKLPGNKVDLAFTPTSFYLAYNSHGIPDTLTNTVKPHMGFWGYTNDIRVFCVYFTSESKPDVALHYQIQRYYDFADWWSDKNDGLSPNISDYITFKKVSSGYRVMATSSSYIQVDSVITQQDFNDMSVTIYNGVSFSNDDVFTLTVGDFYFGYNYNESTLVPFIVRNLGDSNDGMVMCMYSDGNYSCQLRPYIKVTENQDDPSSMDLELYKLELHRRVNDWDVRTEYHIEDVAELVIQGLMY